MKLVNKSVPLIVEDFSTLKLESVDIDYSPKLNKIFVRVNFRNSAGKIGQFEVEYSSLRSEIKKIDEKYYLRIREVKAK